MTAQAQPAGRDRLLDRTLGDFIIREKLGQGAFGVVYRAEQPTLAREAVVKVLNPSYQANPAVTERFLREARLASRLDHPFAAHVYAFGLEPDGVLWIAMELVRGTPLGELLRAQGPIPLLRFAPLLERLCEVVHAAHEQGIVHRDLKPANVMVVSRAGRLSPKLLDLGVARVLEVAAAEPAAEDEERELGATRRGNLVGSPSYMAPEQWVDPASADARTDLYALGVLTFEALTGRLPFAGKTVKAVAAAHARDPLPPLGPAFPAELDALLARVTAKQPAARPPSVLEFAAAFRAAAGLAVEKRETPQLGESLRRTLVGGAPQPLAEAVAEMEAVSNVHQAREAMWQVCRVAIRWIGLVALACRMHVRPGEDGGRKVVAEALRALRRRTLSDEEWLELARELCRPFAGRADAHPVPELVSLFFPHDPAGAAAIAALIDGILAVRASLKDGAGGSEDRVRERLARELPLCEKLLGELAFFWDYPLVVARGARAERWMGTRRAQRPTLALRGNPMPAGRPFLVDANGCPVVSLWPLVQILAPTPGSDEEVFFLEGRGRHGARLVSLPGGFERHDEASWEWLRQEARGDASDGAADGDADDEAPYRGLAPFAAGDARRFFGREREIEAFVNRLRVQPLMALVGPSGAGKTSFVHAGVVPALPEGWQAISMRPGPAPLATLLGRLGQHGIDAAELPRSLAGDAGALGTLLRDTCRQRQTSLVLIVDQFEELFTLCRSEEERVRFTVALSRAARAPEDPVRVVIALRDDFLIRSQMLPPLHDRLVQGLQLLATPAAAELERILIEPARLVGYDFEDRELPTEMVREVVEHPGALALLSFTASKLWELRDHTFRQLTRKTYRSLGGVGGALARHADATLAALLPAEQALVREAFRHLVTAEGTRAVLRRGELERVLGDGPRALAVVERLIEARLVVTSEGEGGEDRVEVIHEALLNAWPRLVAWRQEDEEGARLHDQLREAVRLWNDRGRPRGLLWRDDVLADYQRWRARWSGRLTEAEEDFAAASIAEASRGRRARRLALAGALLGLTAGLIALGVVNRQAVRHAEESHQRLLALYQEQGRQWLLGGDPRRALAYLARARAEGADGAGLRFLLGQAERELTVAELSLKGHADAVTWVSFSRDGTRVATSSADGTAQVWDARSGEPLLTLRGHDAQVNHVEFSPSGDRLATGSRDGTARVWSADGRLLYQVVGPGGSVSRVHFSDDGDRLLVCRSEGPSALVDARDGAILATAGVAPSCAFGPDGTRLVVAGGDGTAEIRDAATGAVIAVLPVHRGIPHALDFSPAGDKVLVGGPPGARVFDAGGELIADLPTQRGDLVRAIFNGDGTRVAVSSQDGLVRLFDAAGGELLRVFEGHRDPVMSVDFSSDGTRLLTAGLDGTAKIWSVTSGRLLSTLVGHEGVVWHAEFDPTGARVATAGLDRSARLWSARITRFAALFEGAPGPVFAATFSPDGRTLVTSGADRIDRVLDADSGDARATLAVRSGLSLAAFHPGGGELAVPDGRAVRLWDPRGGEVIATLEGPHAGDAIVAAYSADGKRLVTGGEDGKVVVWDTAARRPLRTLEGHTGVVTSATFDRSGSRVVTASLDGTIRSWDAVTGAPGLVLRQASAVYRISLCSDGRRLLAGTADVMPTIHDLRTGALLLSLAGHKHRIMSVSFNADCSLAATASADDTVKIWDAADGTLLRTFDIPLPTWVDFDAGGRRLAVAGSDGAITVLDVSPESRAPEVLDRWASCQLPFHVVDGRIVPAARGGACE